MTRSDLALKTLPTRMAGTAEERYELITRGLQEVLGEDIIMKILAEGRTPKCYWGQSFDQRSPMVKSECVLQELHPQGNVRSPLLLK